MLQLLLRDYAIACTHISTTVYKPGTHYTTAWTGASWREWKRPSFERAATKEDLNSGSLGYEFGILLLKYRAHAYSSRHYYGLNVASVSGPDVISTWPWWLRPIGVRANIHLGGETDFCPNGEHRLFSHGPAREKKILMNYCSAYFLTVVE